MTLRNSPTRYGAIGQTFHWLTVVFVGAAYLISQGGPETRVYSEPRAFQLSWHETFGIERPEGNAQESLLVSF